MTNCSLRFDKRFICTAAFTMAKSSGAATTVKPISINPLNDLGLGSRMTFILAAAFRTERCHRTCRMPPMNAEAPYSELSPEVVLDALEAVGHPCDGRVLALNSYENRVYQIGIEDGDPVVAKFYRPGRWSDEAIREEHAFSAELAAQEIPVVAPLARGGAPESLHVHEGFRYAVFPRRGGRWPELGSASDREWVGRFLGRIHGVGRAARFHDRKQLNVEELGRDARDFVLDGDWMPDYLAAKYADVTDELLEEVENQASGWGGARLG